MENERIERVIARRAESEVESIAIWEVERALKKMKMGKATGPDDIPVGTWKVIRNTGVNVPLEIFNTIMENEKMPDEWRNSMLIPIFKNKGDIQDCSIYRDIKLMSYTFNMWESIIE